jgi:putative transposase
MARKRSHERERSRKEVEAGVAVSELSRKHGVSASTIYQWRSKFGGKAVSDM